MKFLKIFLIVCLFSFLSAKSDKFSTITIPQSSFLNINIENCDTTCMQNLIDKKLIFSFLSIYDQKIATKNIEENYLIYAQALNIFPTSAVEQPVTDGSIKIAILVPQKTIGRYAVNSVNTVISYLLAQSNEFEIMVFNSNDEAENSIINTIDDIKKHGYTHVIAPVTENGANMLINHSFGLHVFIPTLHNSIFPYAPSNIIFGGIDYNSQILSLQKHSNGRATIFSDGSKLSQSINEIIKNSNNISFQGRFENTNSNFKNFFSRYNISGTSIYYNTPLITTSLLASQLRAYKNRPYSQLSTQINYSPMLLTLTQVADRKNMYIASSIGKIDNNLESINSILGQNLNYDWVSYATSIGTEYLVTKFFKPDMQKIFNEDVLNAQVNYSTYIYKVGSSSFIQDSVISGESEDSDDEYNNDLDDIETKHSDESTQQPSTSYEESVF